jgi:hypothetical protein
MFINLLKPVCLVFINTPLVRRRLAAATSGGDEDS